MNPTLLQQFGRIDIYLFDQLLRGNITPGMRILDAGCGHGRNLVYLLREGYEVFAVDADREAVASVRQLASDCGARLPEQNFQLAFLDRLPFPDRFADVVLCNSVLHFARDDAHFQAMLTELWRVLKPGGLFFCRLGSRIGMSFESVGGNLFLTGDGSVWYLVDESMLLHYTRSLNAELIDPLKTTVVQDHRCMTTWVLHKPWS